MESILSFFSNWSIFENLKWILSGVGVTIFTLIFNFFINKKKTGIDDSEQISYPILQSDRRTSVNSEFMEIESIEYLRRKKYAERKEREYKKKLKDGNIKTKKSTTSIQNKLRSIKKSLRTSLYRKNDFINGRYCLIEVIGEGGFSTVWKAFDQDTGMYVSLKILNDKHSKDNTFVKKFLDGTELSSIAKSKTENVIQIHNKGTAENGAPYIVMELVENGDFESLILEKSISSKKALYIILNLCDVLEKLHTEKVIHRDIKPSNILVDRNFNPKLIDFDLAKQTDDTSYTIHQMGTVFYQAPENLRIPPIITPKVDVYGLAMTTIFAIYGAPLPPEIANNRDVFIDDLNCNEEIKDVLKNATTFDPKLRTPTAKCFGEELEKAINEEKVEVGFRRQIFNNEKKFKKIIYNSILGTLIAILFSRPFFTHFEMVHLSDSVAVSFFHSGIGSVVWGGLFSFAFVVSIIRPFPFLKKYQKRPSIISTAFLTGIAGFFGGAISASLGVLITNRFALVNKIFWLKTNTYDFGTNLFESMIETRFFFAFPINSFFNGLGLGLFLYFAFRKLNHADQLDYFSFPAVSSDSDFKRSAKFVLFSNKRYLPFFLFPILSSVPQFFFLRSHDNVNLVLLKAIGEGIVHGLGATGLSIGFFSTIILPSIKKIGDNK